MPGRGPESPAHLYAVRHRPRGGFRLPRDGVSRREKTLEDVLRTGPLSPATVSPYARQLAGALTAAHAKGVIQSRFKPVNLFLTNEGALEDPRLRHRKVVVAARRARRQTRAGPPERHVHRHGRLCGAGAAAGRRSITGPTSSPSAAVLSEFALPATRRLRAAPRRRHDERDSARTAPRPCHRRCLAACCGHRKMPPRRSGAPVSNLRRSCLPRWRPPSCGGEVELSQRPRPHRSRCSPFADLSPGKGSGVFLRWDGRRAHRRAHGPQRGPGRIAHIGVPVQGTGSRTSARSAAA